MPETSTGNAFELIFRKTANLDLPEAIADNDPKAFQRAVIRDLARTRKRFEKFCGKGIIAPMWSLGALVERQDDRRLSAMLRLASSDDEVVSHLAATAQSSEGMATCFTTLVACDLLLRRPNAFTPEQFLSIYTALARVNVSHLVSTEQTSEGSAEVPEVIPASSQLSAKGEIPFILSLLLEPLKLSKALRTQGTEFLQSNLEECTDTDGTLHSSLAEDMVLWMAPFVRVTLWAEAFRMTWGKKETQNRWKSVVDRATVLMIPHGFITGRQLRDPDSLDTGWDLELLTVAIPLAGFSAKSAPATLISRLARGKRTSSDSSGKPRRRKKQDALSAESDWAAFAVLRNVPEVDADVMSLSWQRAAPRLGLSALGNEIIAGDWNTRASVNEQAVATKSWTCSCWFLDDEVAFLELESKSADGTGHVRQIMLSLDRHFAVITETLAAVDSGATVELESRLCLSSRIVAETNSITRELLLNGDYGTVRVIPTWLDDDRLHQVAGNCEQRERDLVLSAQGKGGVCMSLLLEWDPKRRVNESDWNRLTVTEERRVVTPHEAHAVRVRVGNLQLMLYRSLQTGKGLRTALGHHTAHETVYAEVQQSGETRALVMVEGSPAAEPPPAQQTEA